MSLGAFAPRSVSEGWIDSNTPAISPVAGSTCRARDVVAQARVQVQPASPSPKLVILNETGVAWQDLCTGQAWFDLRFFTHRTTQHVGTADAHVGAKPTQQHHGLRTPLHSHTTEAAATTQGRHACTGTHVRHRLPTFATLKTAWPLSATVLFRFSFASSSASARAGSATALS